jgi:5-methylcytosine-specific restriction endonuclease McrA
MNNRETYKGQRGKEKRQLFDRFRFRVIEDIYKNRFFALFDHQCFKCGAKEKPHPEIGQPPILCIDHHIPMMLGGHLVPGNLVALCRSCNNKKHDRPPEEFYTPDELDKLKPFLEKQCDVFKFCFDWSHWNRDRKGYLVSLGIDPWLADEVLNNPNRLDYIGPATPPEDALSIEFSIDLSDLLGAIVEDEAGIAEHGESLQKLLARTSLKPTLKFSSPKTDYGQVLHAEDRNDDNLQTEESKRRAVDSSVFSSIIALINIDEEQARFNSVSRESYKADALRILGMQAPEWYDHSKGHTFWGYAYVDHVRCLLNSGMFSDGDIQAICDYFSSLAITDGTISPATIAEMAKTKGLIAADRGQIERAVSFLQLARKANPKIAVKKKLAELEKKLELRK